MNVIGDRYQISDVSDVKGQVRDNDLMTLTDDQLYLDLGIGIYFGFWV